MLITLGKKYLLEVQDQTAGTFYVDNNVPHFFYITILHSRCTRLKCFENVSEDLRRNLLHTFNSLATKNEQDAFLSGLISFHAPTRRRPRRPNEQGESEGENSNDDLIVKQFANNAVFTYKVRISDLEVPVCFKAFVAISGIT